MEGCPHAELAIHPDAPAVLLGDCLRDRQPETPPAFANIYPVEALEYGLTLLRGYARAVVLYCHQHFVSANLPRHRDAGAARGMPVRVVQQVNDHLLQLLSVAQVR